MRKGLPFLLLLALVLIGFSIFFGLYEVKFFSSRATITNTSFSVDNSYIFVTPLRASANGQEKIRVTVFILNNQGLGVLGKKVFLAPDAALNIESIQGLTDSYGKAYFDVSASRAGEYYLEVRADDTPLIQKAHLSFN